MKAILASLLAGLLGGGSAWADEQVRRVQEELRKRNLYFGEIDGKATPPFTAALQRYQRRKGFPAAGALDAQTLRSLEIAPSEKADEAWPEVPVLKSDAERALTEADRKHLESLDPPAVAAPPPEPPPPVAEPPNIPDPAQTAPAPLTEEAAEALVREYLGACGANNPAAELDFYADRVAYFDHGTVGREFIEKDVRNYYRRWPQRAYELRECKLLKASGAEAQVQFKIGFLYKNPEHTVRGQTVNTFKASQQKGAWRFTSLKEQRVRR